MSSLQHINDTPLPGDLVEFNPVKGSRYPRVRFLVIATEVDVDVDVDFRGNGGIITLTTLRLASNSYPTRIMRICGSPHIKSGKGKRANVGTYANIAWYYGYDQSNILVTRPT